MSEITPLTTPRQRLRCPECLAVFRSKYGYCPQDGSELLPCGDEPLLGATIAERYVIEEIIGEGAMGMVYRARHVRLPRTFAVKVLFGDLASDAVMRLRFAQEAAAASQLSHPNLVPVVDFGKSERGLLYLIMDFVEGETLAELIHREAPLDPLRVVEITRAMTLGLAHAHAQGLVHRDFKPDNVVMERREGAPAMPRILDFGLAISAREDLDCDARLTQNGFVVGTPVYISPEQARDLPVDHRADLFALGVVMYEMLAGKPPFDGAAMDVAHKNMAEPMPPMAVRNPNAVVPAELEAVVMRLVEKAPEDRYQSAEELLAALDRIEGALTQARATVVDLPRAATLPMPLSPARVAAPVVDPLDDTADGDAVTDLSWNEAVGKRKLMAGVVAVVAALCVVVYALQANRGAKAEETSKAIEVTEADTPAAEHVAVAPAEAPVASPSPGAGAMPVASPSPSPPTSTSTATPTSTVREPERAPASPRIFGAKPRTKVQARRPAAPNRVSEEEQDRVDALARAAGIRDEEAPAPRSSAPAAPRSSAPAMEAPEEASEASVARLVKDYRDVGNALVSLQDTLGSAAAQPYRNRYFQVPYSDALRIPAVRRDALAQLGALRHDIRRALRD